VRRSFTISVASIALGAAPVAAVRGQTITKSHSSGVFLSLGFEDDAISTEQSGGGTTVDERGTGAGLVLGYGFSPRWSMFLGASSAVMNSHGDNRYALAHFDVAARVHFRTGPNIVVPFVQFGLSGFGEAQRVTDVTGTYDVASNGGGVALGAGLNTHFNPRFALSTSLTISGGSFTNYTVDGRRQSLPAVNATSSRLHLGLIWFPGAT
jgi:hypothetical protein